MPAVSREALVDALMDLAAMLHRAGGVGTIIVGRAPTDVPGESYTTGGIVEWKHRTDAKLQAEEHGEVLPSPAQPKVETLEPTDFQPVLEDALADESLPQPDEEEDLSSIPVEQR